MALTKGPQSSVSDLSRAANSAGLDVEWQRKVSHYLQPILSHRFLNNLA